MVTKKRNSISTTLFRVAKQNYYQTTQGLYKYILWVQWPSGYFPKHTSHHVSVPLKDRLNRSQMSKVVYKASCCGLSGFLHWQNQTEIAWPKNWTLQGNHQQRSSISYCRTRHFNWSQFEMGPLVLARGKSDTHCKIKETLLISDLKSSLNENISREKLYLY